MKKLGLILIIVMALSMIPVNALDIKIGEHKAIIDVPQIGVVETDSSFIVDSGSHIEYFKGSTGYDMIKTPSGETLVASQRWTVEYLSGTNWKQAGIPYDVTHTQVNESVEVSRYYTDYANTEIEVKAKTTPEFGTKTDIIINSGEDRNYRIVWSLDGINNDLVSYDENSVTFTSSTDWITIDWNDAFNQYGAITDFEVTDSAGGKKLEVIFNVGLVKQGESLVLDPTYLDSYDISNRNSFRVMADHHPSDSGFASAYGQSFTSGGGGPILGAVFVVEKNGAPTGNVVATLYAHAGVYGTSSVGTGAVLATSDVFDVSTAPAAFDFINFTFTGAEQYVLTAATYYVIMIEKTAGGTFDGADNLYVGVDTTAPSHDGNTVYYENGGWLSLNTRDTIFYVIGAPATAPVNVALTPTPIISLNTPGWVNVTVQDANGVTDLNTVTIQVNTTSDSENFTLRWTQAGDAFSEVSDLENIVVLNPESVRANINATYDLISFNFNITGGQSGQCTVRVTTIDDGALSDVDLYVDAFEFSYYNWNPTADLVDRAFEQFGIIGYLTTITTWVSGISNRFESSLTRLLELILLQFTVIEQVYNFFTTWATDLFAIALTFSTFYHQIMDGTSPWIQPIYNLGNFWDLIGYDLWAPAAPALLFIWWIYSVPERAKQTVGGEIQVFLNDINTAIGLISYFVSIFTSVANAIINYVYGLFPSITP